MNVDFVACLSGFPVTVNPIQSVELNQKRNCRTREAINGKWLPTSQFLAIYCFTRLGMFALLQDNAK